VRLESWEAAQAGEQPKAELEMQRRSSLVFPVGVASGAQAKSPFSSQDEEGGRARVYSNALVEENGKKRRRQD